MAVMYFLPGNVSFSSSNFTEELYFALSFYAQFDDSNNFIHVQ